MKLTTTTQPTFNSVPKNLEGFTIFKNITIEDLKIIEEEKVACIFKKGQQIFKENEPTRGIFYFRYGSAKIVKKDCSRNDRILSLVKPGDILGLKSAIKKIPYTATVICLENSQGYFIPSENLCNLFERYPTFKLNIIRYLCNELDEMEEKISGFALKPLFQRVVELILLLFNNYGIDNDKYIQVPLTRSELANITQTSRQSLTKILEKLRFQKLIDLDKRRIQIQNIEELCKIIELSSPVR